jgi:tRNA A-37 threonylcarbamoyl transferase component Bud32/streptogramin lyase
MTADPRVGTELGGYRIESRLGRGGMSVVYLAHHLGLKRRVALKILAPELAEDQRFRERFIRESEMAASLDHPNIVPIYEAGEAGGSLYIAMRFVDGTDLGALIRTEGPLDPVLAGRIVAQVADALDAAHARGLIHRDVKPANILLAAAGPSGAEHAYLSDFGLTKRTSSVSGLTKTGEFMGTVDYVAPEQIQGRAADGRTDQYSLGCVAYECLTGHPPFRGDNDVAVLWAHVHDPRPSVRAVRPDLPTGVEGAVARAMAIDPDDRYPTCSAFAGDLAGGVGGEAPSRRRAGRRARTSRSRMVAGAVAPVAVIGVILTALALRGGGSTPGATRSSPAPVVVLPRGVNRIDLATNRAVANVPVENPFQEIAVGGEFVWVIDTTGMAKVDPATNRQFGHLDGRYSHLAGESDGVWTFDIDAGNIVFVDSTTNRAHRVRTLTRGVSDLVAADGFLWYTNARGAGTLGEDVVVVRVNPTTGKSRVFHPKSVPGGCSFQGCNLNVLAVGGGAAWYINEDGTLTRLDIATGQDQKIAVPKVAGVALGEGSVWILLTNEPKVIQLDPNRMEPVKEIPVGQDSLSITVGAGSLWVVSRGEGSVWRIDPSSGKTVRIGIGPGPGEVAVDDGSAWVVR